MFSCLSTRPPCRGQYTGRSHTNTYVTYQLSLGVVQVNGFKCCETNHVIELTHHRVIVVLSANVVACCKRVTPVKVSMNIRVLLALTCPNTRQCVQGFVWLNCSKVSLH